MMTGNDKIIKKMSASFDCIITIAFVIACSMVIYLMLSVCTDVAVRNSMNESIPYISDISAILIVFITFLSIAHVQKIEGHVKMEVILSRLSPERQVLVNMIHCIVMAVICLVLTWYGSVVTLSLAQRGILTQTMLVIPRAPLIGVIPFGFFLLFIQSLMTFYSYLKKWQAYRKP
jgi:C4-dicarboxylate transporter DctQ subunit